MKSNGEFNSGFILIELLVVIAIIGILATAAIPHVMNAICDARVAAIQSEMGTFQTALQQVIVENNAVNTAAELADECNRDDCQIMEPHLPPILWETPSGMSAVESAGGVLIVYHASTDYDHHDASGCQWVDEDETNIDGNNRPALNLDTGSYDTWGGGV